MMAQARNGGKEEYELNTHQYDVQTCACLPVCETIAITCDAIWALSTKRPCVYLYQDTRQMSVDIYLMRLGCHIGHPFPQPPSHTYLPPPLFSFPLSFSI